ncbi:helix-turn-helix domain-containing protein [Paenibacillus doosanensis]|uniref:Helix-turn-helix domain protein n=1 Tax=Paenibacillus konkukensis TaxID=2020716 RepID=A0ABY4RZ44_9BACL|nr:MULTISPECIES: RodZ domain-containing protein [Paenibacillus]MCS7461825.1 helix-turn-helix domain-containing protein [Paenibacillus doosanensis]UQZ87407.1 Helix-turn-helix domain protein [Paenibacillus konkukensis]
MTDLGQLLRKARLDKKISLEQLEETTKIRKRYLEAIEDGDYKVLPGNFYVRAFIKSYAEAVGMDPNEVLRMYQNVIPTPEPEHIEPIRAKRTGRNTEKIGKYASTIMMVSFVILILGIIYYYINANYNGKQQEAGASNEPNRVTDKGEPASVTGDTYGISLNASTPTPTPTPTPPPAPQVDVKLVKSQNGTDFYSVSNTDKLKIEMKVTGDACWVQIDSLGETRKTLEQGTYTSGEAPNWELDNSAFMIFGRSNAVELTVNGTSITVGDTPNAKRIQIDLAKA